MKHLRAKIKDGKHAPNTSEGKKKNSCETLQILVNKPTAYCTTTVVLRLTGVTFS